MGLLLSGFMAAHGPADENKKTETNVRPEQAAAGVTEPARTGNEPAEVFPVDKARVLVEQHGIEVVGIRSTAAGYMLDFRYKVLDPAKAASLFKDGMKPYLIDQGSDVHVGVPAPAKVGALRTSYRSFGEVTPGQQCFIIFANPARYIKPGNKVTVVLGDVQITDLIVQ
ncbi:MAG: hypothetical protein JXQ27_11115 [Acidobacteria bacterium]|nr:hypothetical protein [Acidobacteriota bacterium]